MQTRKAFVAWLTAGQGGRSTIFSGDRYSAPVRFQVEEDPTPGITWSFVLEKVTALDNLCESIAEVRFLVPEAPQELLTAGAVFELFEGRRRVAIGTILASVTDAKMTP